MNLRAIMGFRSGPTGARSRDLRIKRPRIQGLRSAWKIAVSWVLAKYSEPSANHEFGSARNHSSIDWVVIDQPLDSVVDVSLERESDRDVFAVLRLVTT